MVRVVPPFDHVVKSQGIPGSVDEKRQSQEHVGGVGIARLASAQRPDQWDDEGGHGVSGQSPDESFTFELLEPRERPE